MDAEAKYGSTTLQEYENQFWSCINCFCGLCIESCPAYRELHNEAVSARGLAQIGLSLLAGELDLSDLSDEILNACIGCRWCETVCSMNTPTYIKNHGTRKTIVSGATMAEIFRSLKISESGRIPMEIKNALVSLSRYGNPYGVGETVKDAWVASLDLPGNESHRILYVGSTVPYDDNAKSMALAVIEILKACQLDFTMLGSRERESGAFARMIGDEWLFSEMVEHNLKMFHDNDVREIIYISPHDYYTAKHFYPEMEHIEVKHYTQLIYEMMKNGALNFKKDHPKRVTYHDPCYLGRQCGMYDEPREILKNIPGLEFVEMERSGEQALCCGGGGTGLLYDLQCVNIDKARVDQIREVNPDCVAVACPNCYQMLDGAAKSRNYDFAVKDIAQIVAETL